VGHDAALFAHAIEGTRFSLAAIHIGNNVTIGATAVVMSDVVIGDGAIVSAGAVVNKGTRIGAGEVWGGCLRNACASGAASSQACFASANHAESGRFAANSLSELFTPAPLPEPSPHT